MLKVLLQLAKEFWLPMVVSIAWTIFNFKQIDTKNLALKDIVNVFGPTFFLASWLLAQFFRVKNQQHVRSGLTNIEKGISELGQQASQSLKVNEQLIRESYARKIKAGAPKFQVLQNDRLPDRFFIDSDFKQTPYFAWITNYGKTVYDVDISIDGATLQMVQGDQKSDYVFHLPTWATGMCFRIAWTYPERSISTSSTLNIGYTDTFDEKSSAAFSIVPGGEFDQDGIETLVIIELLRSGAKFPHAGEPNYGYNYDLHEERRTFKAELEKMESTATTNILANKEDRES